MRNHRYDFMFPTFWSRGKTLRLKLGDVFVCQMFGRDQEGKQHPSHLSNIQVVEVSPVGVKFVEIPYSAWRNGKHKCQHVPHEMEWVCESEGHRARREAAASA